MNTEEKNCQVEVIPDLKIKKLRGPKHLKHNLTSPWCIKEYLEVGENMIIKYKYIKYASVNMNWLATSIIHTEYTQNSTVLEMVQYIRSRLITELPHTRFLT
jgi:DNA-directed RNA polymerase beta' subunit